jgi:hypothetical protein
MGNWLTWALVSASSIQFHDTWHLVSAFINNRSVWRECLQLPCRRNISWKRELVIAWQNCGIILTTGPRSRWCGWNIEMNVTGRIGVCVCVCVCVCVLDLFGSRMAFVKTIIVIGFQWNSRNFGSAEALLVSELELICVQLVWSASVRRSEKT